MLHLLVLSDIFEPSICNSTLLLIFLCSLLAYWNYFSFKQKCFFIELFCWRLFRFVIKTSLQNWVKLYWLTFNMNLKSIQWLFVLFPRVISQMWWAGRCRSVPPVRASSSPTSCFLGRSFHVTSSSTWQTSRWPTCWSSWEPRWRWVLQTSSCPWNVKQCVKILFSKSLFLALYLFAFIVKKLYFIMLIFSYDMSVYNSWIRFCHLYS